MNAAPNICVRGGGGVSRVSSMSVSRHTLQSIGLTNISVNIYIECKSVLSSHDVITNYMACEPTIPGIGKATSNDNDNNREV